MHEVLDDHFFPVILTEDNSNSEYKSWTEATRKKLPAAAFYNVSPFIFVKKDNFVEFLGGLTSALAWLKSEYELTQFVARNIA